MHVRRHRTDLLQACRGYKGQMSVLIVKETTGLQSGQGQPDREYQVRLESLLVGAETGLR